MVCFSINSSLYLLAAQGKTELSKTAVTENDQNACYPGYFTYLLKKEVTVHIYYLC